MFDEKNSVFTSPIMLLLRKRNILKPNEHFYPLEILIIKRLLRYKKYYILMHAILKFRNTAVITKESSQNNSVIVSRGILYEAMKVSK